MIKQINIENFGKLSDVTLNASSNLNIIYAPNEGGKTTLLEFIKFVFYGTSRKKNKSELPFKEKYMPWNGMPMSGSIILEYNNKSYIIYRREGAKNGSKDMEVRNASTGEVYTHISEPGKYFFGVDENVFSDTFFSTDANPFFEPGQDVASIVYGTGASELSYIKIRQSLEEKILNLSSSRRAKSDYSVTQNEICKIQEEILLAEKEHKRLESIVNSDISEKERLEKSHEKLCEELNIAKQHCIEEDVSKKILTKKKEEENLSNLILQLESLNQSNGSSSNNRVFGSSIAKVIIGAFSLILSIVFAIMAINVDKGFLIYGAIMLVCFLYTVLSEILSNKRSGKSIEENNGYKDVLAGQIELSRSRIREYEEEINKVSPKIINGRDNTTFPDNINTFTKEEIDGIINKIRMCEADIKVVDSRIRSSDHKLRVLSAQREYFRQRLSALDGKLSQIERKTKVLETAVSILDSAFYTLRDSVAPKISQMAFEIFDSVCASGYAGLVADNDFNASIRVGGEFKSVKSFSRSTRDLADLSLRIAICDALSHKQSLPVFLDDVLASFDDERSLKMMKCIRKIAEDRQIFVCTCRRREVTVEDSEINVINLGKDDNNG